MTRIEQYNDAGITPTYTLGIGSGNTGLTASQLPGINATDLCVGEQPARDPGRLHDQLHAELQRVLADLGVRQQLHQHYGTTSSITTPFTARMHWKLSRRLTLTVGARWDYYTPVDERDALALLPVLQNNNVLQTIFNPNTTLDFAGSAVGRPWYKSDKNNIAPNIGLGVGSDGRRQVGHPRRLFDVLRQRQRHPRHGQQPVHQCRPAHPRSASRGFPDSCAAGSRRS